VNVTETSRLLGAGGAYRRELCASCVAGPVFGLVGYRYLRLRDDLQISTASIVTDPFAVFTGTFAVADHFKTLNQFHGADLGIMGLIAHGPWTLDWRATVALGATLTDVSIDGSTTFIEQGTTTTFAGGVLALASNSGVRRASRFSAVPEFNARLGYQLTPHWRAFAGYNLIYWTGVARPGGAIDTMIDPLQLPPALAAGARPAPQSNSTDFWAQGVNFGLAFNY
jgi:hypothetical protein